MGEAQATRLDTIDQESSTGSRRIDQVTPHERINIIDNGQPTPQSAPPPPIRSCLWWVEVAVYALLVLAGQSSATILGRLYYAKGGHSKWMSTLVQVVGFPLLIPSLLFFSSAAQIGITTTDQSIDYHRPPSPPSALALAAVYVSVGILLAGVTMLYSIGLQYLPVSTFSLITASQLGFNAFFSFFLNSLKFTAPIINSITLLTVSSVLLVFQPDSSSGGAASSRSKYTVGFLCTIGGAAGYALILSLTQLFFRKVLKVESFRQVLQMLICQSLVASSVVVVGLFASGDWMKLRKEMAEFELGRSSYVQTLVWTALTWQLFTLGLLGLIFKVSALFANVIGTLGLPIVPVLAVIFFNDKMTGVKVVALLLAVWGFVSYMYQHHLDGLNSSAYAKEIAAVAEDAGGNVVSEISLAEKC